MSPAFPAAPVRAISLGPGRLRPVPLCPGLRGSAWPGEGGPRPAPCAETSGAGALLRSAPQGRARQRRLAGGTPRPPRCRHGPAGPQTKGAASCPPPHRGARGPAPRGSGRWAKREPEGTEGEGGAFAFPFGRSSWGTGGAAARPPAPSRRGGEGRGACASRRREGNVGLLLKHQSLLDVLVAMA